jgi:hypothetical protein
MSGSGERDARSAADRTKCGRGRGRWPRRRPEEEGVAEERVEIVGRGGGGRLRVYSTDRHFL